MSKEAREVEAKLHLAAAEATSFILKLMNLLLHPPRGASLMFWLLAWLMSEQRLTSDPSAQSSWPQFRGQQGQGRAIQEELPLPFGPTQSIKWQNPIGSGHSSPCIWGDNLFITAHEEGALQILALNRHDGKLLWKHGLPPSSIERGHRNGTPANSTSATNGSILVTYFGSFGLIAHELNGTEIWRHPLPVPITQHGASTSPVLHGDRVILQIDQDVDSYLLCLEISSGKMLWKVDRPGFRRGFSTPILWPPESDDPSIITTGTLRIQAYDPAGGQLRWEIGGLPNEMVASPAFDEDHLFVSGWTMGSGVPSLPEFKTLMTEDANDDGQIQREEASGAARMHFPYIDADKNGGIDQSEWESMKAIFEQSENALIALKRTPDTKGTPVLAWKQQRGLPYVPSPLAYAGRVFMVKNGGMLTCLNALSGEPIYREERLGALGDYYSSPIGVGDHVLVASQRGVVTVVKAQANELELAYQIDLGQGIMATPAMVDGNLYLRTTETLYCFGRP